MRIGILFIFFFINLLLFLGHCEANIENEPLYGVAIYSGPGSMIPLVEIARFRQFSIENSYMIAGAVSRTLWRPSNEISFEVEGSLTKYFENMRAFSLAGAFALRWLKTPWSSEYGGVRSTFAFGNGLSYANEIPELETRLSKTSNLLYHLYIEITLSWKQDIPWEFLFRIHHRSGAFGLFNGVVGGSDFLCLGVRYRF